MKIKDEFIKESGLMVLAIGTVNFFHLLFHLFMVRSLSTVDYGIFNSLLAMFVIITVPAATIQTVITKFVSHFQAYNRLGKIRFLIRHLGKRIFLTAVALFLIMMAARNNLTDFLQLPGNQFIVLLGLLLSLAIILPLFCGGLQGLQKFGFLGLNMVIGSGLKLVLGVICVILGFRVMGVLGALLAAGIAQLYFSYIYLRRSLRLKEKAVLQNPAHLADPYNDDISSGIRLPEIYRFFLPVTLAHFCFMALTNSDIILVKHFFSPLDAGRYSVASVVGKMIFFLPGAISIVMFPKTSKLYAEEKGSIDVLKKSLLYSGLLCIIVGLVFFFYPSFLVKLLSVKDVEIFIPLARLFVIAMTCFALIYIIMLYSLSIHNLRFLYTMVISLLLQVILIWVLHPTVVYVISIVAINAALLFGINLWIVAQGSRVRQID